MRGWTLAEYHKRAGCEPYVEDVKVPMLCVNSLDDPVSEYKKLVH